MPHEPGHINGNAPYKVYGTNEPYSGLTVEIGGYLYTTKGGAFEGDSLQLIANPQVQQQPQQDQQNQLMGGAGLTTNPNQQQQDQLMSGPGVNPNQDQQNQLMSGPGVNPNQDLQDTIAY
mgnify:CR=1 FL=1|tara:strand:+ start:35 stop:394 length:360 start_codon:yes stop_codon:yes gene_type:complete